VFYCLFYFFHKRRPQKFTAPWRAILRHWRRGRDEQIDLGDDIIQSLNRLRSDGMLLWCGAIASKSNAPRFSNQRTFPAVPLTG
jgi:hypothetical protein